MGIGEILLLTCAVLWAMHVLGLLRAPIGRTWQGLLIVAFGVGISLSGYFFLREHAAAIAMASVMVLLVAPALATHAASRALRFGRIGRARALAMAAFVLRPLPIQARFRRALDASWRLASGEALDIERALDGFGRLEPRERRIHRVGLLSWTNDFQAIATELRDTGVRSAALRSGMAASVCIAIGETGTTTNVCALHRELAQLGAFRRRTLDGASALLYVAAYLGDAEAVRTHARHLADDVPAERLAFAIATAEQKSGRAKAARTTLEQALASKGLSAAARSRLEYRRDHPAEPLTRDAGADAVLDDVRQRLDAQRVLGALGFGFRRPMPLTWVIACVLTLVFVFEVRALARDDVFARWGLVAPFASAPDLYRLLTYALLHLDVGHLLVNLVGLLVFGRFVESHFGVMRYLVIYLVGAVVGGLAFLLFTTQLGGAIGASGAVLALFGATMARIAFDARLRNSQQGRRELLFLALIAIAQLVGDSLLTQSSGSAHAGGFIAGFIIGGAFRLARRGSAAS